MYAKVTTSLAALIVIVPAMVMTTPASADRGGARPTATAKPSNSMSRRMHEKRVEKWRQEGEAS